MTRPPFPFSALVGQGAMRAALLVQAVDPVIGGVLVRGHKGTGKSTAVRALAALLPAIEVVTGCPLHCGPDAPGADHLPCSGYRERGEPVPRASRAMPFVELPLNATEDRLVGTLQLEEALRSGRRRFEPGLLAAAHRGLLYVDEVNLLEDHLVDLLLDAASSGVQRVERDGISVEHPCELQLVGTMNPEEGELRPQFLDRFGLCVTVQGLTTLAEREELVRRRLAYEQDPAAFAVRYAEAERAVGAQVCAARERLAGVRLPDELLRLAVRLAARAGTRGHRAEIAMVRTARALAALLAHETVGLAELGEAARYALAHRLADGPLANPDDAGCRVDELWDELLGGRERREGPQPGPQDGDELAGELAEADEALRLAESMQVPGSMAAGSILFIVEKKSPPSACSAPTKPSA